MSDFLRRASDAFHHRQRKDSTGSTGSTDAPKAPDTANPPQQEPTNQQSEPAQPESHVNEAFLVLQQRILPTRNTPVTGAGHIAKK